MMVQKNILKNHLSKALCTVCGKSLDTAKLVPLNEMPMAIVAHATCQQCNGANMVTITSLGTGVLPIMSDLTGSEVKKFVSSDAITYKDVLDLHQLLEETDICNLMRKKEKKKEKKTKN